MRTLINTTVNSLLMAAAASAELPRGGSGGNAAQNTLGTAGKSLEALKEDTSVDGMTMGEIANEDNLQKKDLKAAYKAIDAAYDIQWGTGGILETEEKLKGLQGKISERVYDVAKAAMERCKGKVIVARVYFLALCDKAEQHIQNVYTEKYKETIPMGQLIPLWTQYKSKFAKGMEKGIDPMARDDDAGSLLYATAAQYRAAVDAVEKKDRETGSQAGNDRNSNNQTSTTVQLVTKGWSPHISAAMDVLCQGLNRLTHEEQDKFSDALLELGHAVTERAEALEKAYADSGSPENRQTTQDADAGTTAAMQKALDEANAAPKSQTAANKPKRGTKAA